MPVVVDEEYRKQIEKARRHLRALISAENRAPLMLRLALNDAETYDPNDKIKGGPNGSIRSPAELKREINKGLDEAVKLCGQVLEQCPKITHADLYQLAGVVAVEITGGPSIEFNPGREDSMESPEEDRLPSDKHDATQLRKIIKRMGLEVEDFVVLYGGLNTLMVKPEAGKPIKFDNSYFKGLKKKGELSAAEKALLQDKEFSEIVNQYAGDEDKFLRDYAAAHKKVSELGFTSSPPATSVPSTETNSASWNRARLAQGAIGIALATTVVILGYFLSRRNKQ